MSSISGHEGCKDCEMKPVMFGVRLACEMHVSDYQKDACLGVIVLENSGCTDTVLAVIRDEICRQLHALPDAFIFLTSQGWSITRNQEHSIKLSQILACNRTAIRIQHSYGKARIGILTNEDKAVGFVFVDTKSSLNALRQTVEDQLSLYEAISKAAFHFLDRNGWPVLRDQESQMDVVDIISSSCVRIALSSCAVDAVDHHVPICNTTSTVTKMKRSISTVTYASKRRCIPVGSRGDDLDDVRYLASQSDGNNTSKPKQILLSYVRAEAANHALRLKQSLIRRGFSVFLDVHEIKFGTDWQDALNNAVSCCEYFIPLVTPRYGETLWTNREVKLADILSKSILPVSFLDAWPPKCLAIQFATTQYIPWKQRSSDKHSDHGNSQELQCARDIQIWTDAEISIVAKEITDRIKLIMASSAATCGASARGQLVKQVSSLRSFPQSTRNEFLPMTQPREGRPLIVISLHPDQSEFGQRLEKILSAAGDYEIWLSTELVQVETEEEDVIGSQNMFDDDEPQLPFGLSELPTQPMPFDSLSQKSGMSCLSSGHSDRVKRFQEKANEAGVVIFVLSTSSAESKFTRDQVFYCEHRKRVIPVCYEDIKMPAWMSMLIGTRKLENASSASFAESFTSRVKRALNAMQPSEDEDEETNEEIISSMVIDLRQQMSAAISLCQSRSDKEVKNSRVSSTVALGRLIYVYISGSTKFYCPKSQEICRSIGQYLAMVNGVHIVTGGFAGVGEEVGRTYDYKRREMGQNSNIWHILPSRDNEDFSRKGRQNSDRTFQPLDYGTTLFIGNSVRQRELITSRAFDVCIIIEGGPGAAHEVEQFAWNDHVVIPVKCTEGAAGGMFGVPKKIFELPAGVEAADWSVLGDSSATPDEVGHAVKNVVVSIRDRLTLESPTAYACDTSPDFTLVNDNNNNDDDDHHGPDVNCTVENCLKASDSTDDEDIVADD